MDHLFDFFLSSKKAIMRLTIVMKMIAFKSRFSEAKGFALSAGAEHLVIAYEKLEM